MKLIKISNASPDIGRKIVILYEDSVGNLEAIVDRYDGLLTHRPEMKGCIYWIYFDHFIQDLSDTIHILGEYSDSKS